MGGKFVLVDAENVYETQIKQNIWKHKTGANACFCFKRVQRKSILPLRRGYICTNHFRIETINIRGRSILFSGEPNAKTEKVLE